MCGRWNITKKDVPINRTSSSDEDKLIHVTTNVDLILTKTEKKAPHDSSRNLQCWQWLVMESTGDTISLLRGRWISRAARVCLSWYVDILWLYHKTHAAILEVPLINELQDKEEVLHDTHNRLKLLHRQTDSTIPSRGCLVKTKELLSLWNHLSVHQVKEILYLFHEEEESVMVCVYHNNHHLFQLNAR